MRRGIVAFIALGIVGLALTGCGLNHFAEREPWRRQAEETCLAQKQVQPSAYMSMASEIAGPGVCGISHPFKVAAFASGGIGLARQVTLACPMIPRIDAWLDEVVQPAANLYFATAVVEIRAGTYNCRSRNNQRGGKLSEHAFGNAIDVMSFRFEDGRELTVVKGWRGASEEQDFLREVFIGACRYFTTVLGPGSDAFHYNHFHLDLARHDPRGERHVCKPVIKFAPRLDPGAVAMPRRAPAERPVIRAMPQPEEPGDVEDDEDPLAVSAATPRPGAAQAAALPAMRQAPSPPPPAAAMAYRDIPAAMSTYRDPPPPRREPLEPPPAPMPPSRSAAGPVVLQPQLWTAKPIY